MSRSFEDGNHDGGLALRECRARLCPGNGLVARYPEAVVVIPHAGEGPAARAILGIVESESRVSDMPGRRIARRLAGLLGAGEADASIAFGLVARADPGIVIFLAGDVDAEVTGAAGTQAYSGRDVASWVDRLIMEPLTGVVLAGAGDTEAHPLELSDLRLGIVPGSGVVLSPRGSQAEADEQPETVLTPEVVAATPSDMSTPAGTPPPPSPVADRPAAAARDHVPISLDGPAPQRAPLPIAGDTPVEPAGELVEGILCSRMHFNEEHALYCRQCGISMVNITHNLTKGERPPLGFLVLEDGTTFVVDGDYVIGREPDSDPSVGDGRIRPLVVPDPDRTVSRVHARISLEGWNVRIGDAKSANGTYVAEPGETSWTRLQPDELRTIRPGTRILVGRRPLVFESQQRA